jgi:hypothetical protein
MFRFVSVVAFGAVLVSGCATTPPVMRWAGNNHATQEQFMNDRSTCFNEAEKQISDGSVDQTKAYAVDGPMCRAFNACLAAHGYTRSDASGNLTIPADASVQCATPSGT